VGLPEFHSKIKRLARRSNAKRLSFLTGICDIAIMKKSFWPVFLAILVLFATGGLVVKLVFERQRQFQKVEIPASYLETSDTSRFSITPITLLRTFSDDSLLVFFPKPETHSQLYLYDQPNYNRLLFGDHHGVPVFLPDLEGFTAMNGRPVVNLSRFPQGKYYVHVTACNFGGFLQFDIRDSLP
jgi:hypothetical protein